MHGHKLALQRATLITPSVPQITSIWPAEKILGFSFYPDGAYGQNGVKIWFFLTTFWGHAVGAVGSYTSVCTKGMRESLMNARGFIPICVIKYSYQDSTS